LQFIPAAENTVHFLMAQIRLKLLFYSSSYSSWTYIK